MNNKKPKLDQTISLKDFSDYYWMKKDLQEFCGKIGITSTGGKLEIIERIKHFLKTGDRLIPTPVTKKQETVDATRAFFSLETRAGTNFRCTRKVRDFFEAKAGKDFHFSVSLQKFIKANPKVTFQEIIVEWARQGEQKKAGLKQQIGPQFEYNQFTRDFFADPENRNKTPKDCISAWKEIRAKRGSRNYHPKG